MVDTEKKRFVSGVKPTGRPHIGNYFGAMRQFVQYQSTMEGYVFIADLHALTTINNPDELKANTEDIVLDYLAIGLDPKKVILYKQSDIPAHTELAWIFNTLISKAYLERAHAFKDAEAKGKEVNMGTFDYPILMAADILLYDPNYVPVGKDQKQHVEIAREVARKFNSTYGGKLFREPEEIIYDDIGAIPGTDGRKMSKSYNNTIGLFDSDEEIEKKVMSIVTDSDKDKPTNVFEIHRHVYCKNHEYDNNDPIITLEGIYKNNAGKYKILKQMLIDDLKIFIGNLREKRGTINKEEAMNILKAGGQKAREIADRKMAEVRSKIGTRLY